MTDYTARVYRLDPETVRSLMRLSPSRSIVALCTAWVSLIFLVTSIRFWIPTEWVPYAYIPFIFLIAGRFGVLLQLIHEASHRLITPVKKTNDFIARWFCGLPVGVFFEGYMMGHMRHHSGTNTEEDPVADREKYRITDRANPYLYALFLKDLLGITAVSIFFAYKDKEGAKNPAPSSKIEALISFSKLCFAQTILLGLLFQFDIADYILYWLIPAVSPHMFLMRVRGIAEHGLAGQKGVTITQASEGNFYTRSFLTSINTYRFAPLIWIEKLLIGSLSVHHHHEHHLFPTVPFYHLKALHALVGPEVHKRNPDVYAKGYFAAAFRPSEHPLVVPLMEPA